MMKRILLLSCLALLAVAGRMQAQCVTVDGIEYTVDTDGQTAAVTGYTGTPVDVVIPATVTIDGTDYAVACIGLGAFWYCDALQSIVLPEGLRAIGSMVFAYCASLAGIVLPSTMQYIDATAFADCPLKEVYSHAAVPPTVSNGLFDEEIYAVATLHVPSNAVDDYRIAEGWKQFQHIEGDLPSTAISNVATDASIATYANGILTTSAPATITVYAQSGARVLHAAEATSLSLEALPRGIYIICVAQGGQRQVMKVLH